MKIYLLVQARSSSTRLPFKSLLYIKKYFSIELLYKRVKSKKYQTLVLTSNDSSDEYFAYILKKKNIPFFRGDLLNVKKRFLNFRKNLKPDDILVRLTGDNIFVDKFLVKLLIRKIIKEKKKYVFIGNKYLDIPYGISVEAFRFSELKKNKINSAKEIEHVTRSFKRTKDNLVKTPKENYRWKKLNCSIDYFKNYYDVRKVFQKTKKPTTISWYNLCNLLEKTSKKQIKRVIKKIKLISLRSKNLNKSLIRKICKLKNQEWNYSLKSQIKHFIKEFNHKDINNMIFKGNKLIGYTILRHKNIKINNLKKNFLLLDTIIIDNSFRDKNLGEILMYFNNNQILVSDNYSILQCKNKHINFYKKFNWKKINKKNLNFENRNNKLNLMSFNYH